VFYLFFPLVCWFLGRGWKLIGLLLVFVVLGPFGRTVFTRGNGVWKEYSYLGGMDAIALGCLTALLVSGSRFSRSAARGLGIAGGVLPIFILCFSTQSFNWTLERGGRSLRSAHAWLRRRRRLAGRVRAG
jgi:peptidoglycan/LPS O-acetylase OafA/YrhL